MRLLVTRPQPGNDATAQRARAAGFDVIQLPLFEIAPRPWQVPQPGDFDALLITSANAVRHAGDGLAQLAALPVHAVGARSADAARGAGLKVASAGTTDAHGALRAAAAAGHDRLLWLAGADRSDPAPFPPVSIEARCVYAAEPIEIGNAAAALAATDAVALHSARAARRLCALLAAAGISRASIAILAFSMPIAQAAGTGWRAVAIAERPDDSALLSAARSLGKQVPES